VADWLSDKRSAAVIAEFEAVTNRSHFDARLCANSGPHFLLFFRLRERTLGEAAVLTTERKFDYGIDLASADLADYHYGEP
jgi:hypothetical protein